MRIKKIIQGGILAGVLTVIGSVLVFVSGGTNAPDTTKKYDYSAEADNDGKVEATGRKWGQKITELPVPEKTGYTFAGWFTNPTDDGTQIYPSTAAPTTETDYYAHWIPNKYTLKTILENDTSSSATDGTNTVKAVNSINSVNVAASRTVKKSSGTTTDSLDAVTMQNGSTTTIRFDDSVSLTANLASSYTDDTWYYYDNGNRRHKAKHTISVSTPVFTALTGGVLPSITGNGSLFTFKWTNPGNIQMKVTGKDTVSWTDEESKHTPSITSVTITSTDLSGLSSDGENYLSPHSVTFSNSSGSYDCQKVNGSYRFHYTWSWDGSSYNYSISNSGSKRTRRYQLTFNCDVNGVTNNTVDVTLYKDSSTSASGSAIIPDVWY